MSADLEVVFAELGLSQYLDGFRDQGFESWETILDITESDLYGPALFRPIPFILCSDVLNVKLGHRRKLQRRIANARGISSVATLVTPITPSVEDAKADRHTQRPDVLARNTSADAVIQKRKYRRHPKPDENAPERPPSAYVLTVPRSEMREDLKGQNLSFTEIAKLVGENWQSISPEEKEPFETEAQQAKEKFNQAFRKYKTTSEYRKYSQYLQEFKQKHANQGQGVYIRNNKRKRTRSRHPHRLSARSISVSHDLPTLTKELFWEIKEASKRPKLDHTQNVHRSSTSTVVTNESSSLGGGSGNASESQRGSEPPISKQQQGANSVKSFTDGSSITAETSYQPFVDEPMISPSLIQYDSSLASSPRDVYAPRQWECAKDSEAGNHRYLPSLSDMFDDGKMTRLQLGDSNGYGKYPHNHQLDSRRYENSHNVPNLRHIPQPIHQPSSNGTANSGSPLHPGVPARKPSNASLPIHALLTNEPSRASPPPSSSFSSHPVIARQPELQGGYSNNRASQVLNGTYLQPRSGFLKVQD